MVVSLTKNNIKDVLESSPKPAIIDIFATWCGPCMQMKPTFEALAQELGDLYLFAQINVDEARDLAVSYNVTSVPTFIFIKNNKVVGRELGYMPEEEFRARIKEYLG